MKLTIWVISCSGLEIDGGTNRLQMVGNELKPHPCLDGLIIIILGLGVLGNPTLAVASESLL